MKFFLNDDGRKFFSKKSNIILFILLVGVAYLIFGADGESILMNFLKYFTDNLNIL